MTRRATVAALLLLFSWLVHAQDSHPLDLPVLPPVYNPNPPIYDAAPLPRPPTLPAEDPEDVPPPVLEGGDAIAYVIDISCSMSMGGAPYTDLAGETHSWGSRLDRAKVELQRSVLSLPPNMRFNLLAFGCNHILWSEAEMPLADEPAKASAMAWIRALGLLGATGTAPAVISALHLPGVDAVVLLTDGAPGCGAGWRTAHLEHRWDIAAANDDHIPIDVFGYDAYDIYRAFCVGVAGDSGGSYYDVE